MALKAILIHFYRKSHYLNIKWFWCIFVSIKIIILIKLQTKISWSDFSWAFWSGSKWIFTFDDLTCFFNIPKCIKIFSLLYHIRSLMHDPYKGKAIFWNFLVDQATTISQSLKYLMNYSQILISFIEKWLYDWKANFISLSLYDFVRVMLVTDLDSGWQNFVDAEICHQYRRRPWYSYLFSCCSYG